MVRAWLHCRTLPRAWRTLWVRQNNGLTWGALRAWVRAVRDAGRACRASIYGRGAERVQWVSMDTPQEHGPSIGGVHTWETLSALATRETREDGTRAPLSPVRQLARRSRHARECVMVYHLLSGSRQWRSALSDDLAVLRAATLAARGCGTADLTECGASLVSEDGSAGTGALRKRLFDLRRRLAAGDRTMTDRASEACAALVSYYAGRGQLGRSERVLREMSPGLPASALR